MRMHTCRCRAPLPYRTSPPANLWQPTSPARPFHPPPPSLAGVIFFSLVLFSGPLEPSLAAMGLTPLYAAVLVGAAQNIFSKSSKYSLFDPCKEMAYIPLDSETKVGVACSGSDSAGTHRTARQPVAGPMPCLFQASTGRRPLLHGNLGLSWLDVHTRDPTLRPVPARPPADQGQGRH